MTDGFVKITPTTTTVTIKGGQVTAPFDGGMHEAFGFDIVSIESPLYNASDFAFLGDAFVERSEVGISGMGLSEDQFENVNRNFEYVNFIVTDGFIEITESDLPVQEEAFPEDFEDEDLTDETAEPEETPAEVEAPVTAETEAAPAEGETAETTETEAAPAEGEVTETPEAEETPAEGEVTETPEAEETPAEGEVTETPEAEETPVEGEVTEKATETPEPEAAPETVMVAAGTSIYAEADPESEVILVTGEDTEFVVLGSDENWLNVQLSEDGSGYISRADIPVVEETPAEEDPNVYVIVPAGTDVRADADGMSEIIFTTEEETKMVFIGVEGDWTQVMIDENTVGFIFGADLNLDDKPESAGMKVTIFTSRRSQMEVGEDITLTAVLEGFDDVQNLQYQWECDKGDGFEPVEGATGESYSYPATAESFSWSWRLHLSFD